MEINRLRNVGPKNPGVVVALFGQTKQVRDAVADLTHAGFDKWQIRVAFASESQQNSKGNKANHNGSNGHLRKQHTLSWLLRRSFELDLHRSGKDQLAGTDKKDLSSAKLDEQYLKVDLHATLLALCAKEERIRLLKSEIGTSGALVLVDADDRWNEAESILARVAGKIRTDTATEKLPSVK
jgi:hypothetical protein